MIKLDLVNELVYKTGITKTKAEMAVDAVFESMKRTLTEGNRIEFRGFGIFNVRPRKTGIGRNPPHDLARHLAGRDRSSHRYDQLCR